MYKHFFKRLFDIVFAILLLPFVIISFIIFAPIIYLTDKGPVFYNADRRGKNGKVFKMFKYRSMFVNSEVLHNADGSRYTGDNDVRVTKVGKIMRKLSIDELPQIVNVLIGDMSFIGPRPVIPNTPYEELSDIRKKRLTVLPGITGYAQAYYRNSITQDEKFKYDCYYVDNLSFLLDLKILFYSFYSVLASKNINHDDTKSQEKAKESVTK